MKYLSVGFLIGVTATLSILALAGMDDANIKEVGVEWVNQYNGTAPNLGATDDDAIGFYNVMGAKGWTKVYNWGDNNAWEEDFKSPEKAGGGNDASYADNVDFAYFSGHGNTVGFYFGVNRDDTQAHANDCVWGDKDLEWIALSACLTQNWDNGNIWGRWGWPVFKGLHMILGMDTVMADTPDQGAYFARFMTGDWAHPSWGTKLKIHDAWDRAGWWCLPGGQYTAVLGAKGAAGDSWDDWLPGYGPQVPDPYPISYLWWYRSPC